MKKWMLYGIIGLGLAIVLFLGYHFWQASRWHDKYNRLEGKSQAASERFEEALEEAKKEADRLAKSLNEEVKIREKADKEIVKLEANKTKLAGDLAREKDKTKSLTPDELVCELVIEIGSEVRMMGSGYFEFTRKGAEFTLNKFRDGAFNLKQYNEQLDITKELEAKIASYDKSLADFEKLKLSRHTALEKCQDALKASENSKEALRKTFKSSQWKNLTIGAGAIAVVAVTLRLFKVI